MFKMADVSHKENFSQHKAALGDQDNTMLLLDIVWQLCHQIVQP
jgi:hypothetical protein